ncbi:N-acetyltransferase family protein [Anatilimnocola sp. NA78]|uniref:GNAT family N-acetyltransferase n=1 Tax=Anatilimnocola sp. NA78 TaxID=3415683 RepID=UPI003CE5B109
MPDSTPTTAITIRAAEPADLDALREIYLRSRAATFFWTDAAKLQLADFDAATQDEPILVAMSGKEIAGFVSWWPPDNFIHNLFVDPAYLRRGIGRLLLHACLQQIGRPAILKCVQANEPAMAFYRAQGWTIAGEGTGDRGPYYLLQSGSTLP